VGVTGVMRGGDQGGIGVSLLVLIVWDPFLYVYFFMFILFFFSLSFLSFLIDFLN
jgi:hypothetical protein